MFDGPMSRLGALPVVSVGLFSCSDPPPDPPPAPTILRIRAADAVTARPVPSARVLIDDRWHDLGDDGTVELTLVGAEYAYRAEAPGYSTEPRPFRSSPEIVVAPQETTELDLELQPVDVPTGSGGIAGRVTGTAAPLAGALVVAIGTRIRSTLTDKAGAYRIEGLAADLYSVEVHAAEFAFPRRTGVRVDNTILEDVDIDGVAAAGATIGGRLRQGTGRTTVFAVDPSSGWPVPGLSVSTNLGSVYAIPSVPPGTYRLEAALEIEDNWVLDVERLLEDGPPEVIVTDTSTVVVADLFAQPSIKGIVPSLTETTTVSPPILTWREVDDASFYVVEVLDESGQSLFGGFDASGNPRIRVLPPDTSIAYGGSPLVKGARYMWRVFAAEQDILNPSQFDVTAASELLEGDFIAGVP
jgi:hypothetical protein